MSASNWCQVADAVCPVLRLVCSYSLPCFALPVVVACSTKLSMDSSWITWTTGALAS